MLNLPPPYDSIRELGVYDQLPSDVRTQLLGLSSYPLPPSAQAMAEDAMIEHLGKAEIRLSLVNEAKALRDRAVKVDEAFERVRQGLGQVDANDYEDKNGKPIPKFQTTWIGYQKRWTSLLWGSRDVATKTEAYIKDFLEVIIPEVECIETKDDLSDATLDLDMFIQREDPKQLNSKETVNLTQKYSQDFTDLKRDLETFQATFDELFAKDHKVNFGVAITVKQAEIQRLDQEIKLCETVVMAMGIALGATVCVAHAGAVGALASLGPISPYIATGVVIVGAIAAISEPKFLLKYVARTEEKKTKRATAQMSLERLQGRLKELQALQAMLENQKANIPDTGGRLDRFAAIWGLVRHDAELIQSSLNAAVGDKGFNEALKKRMDLMKASYTKLCEALNLYATTINKPLNLASQL